MVLMIPGLFEFAAPPRTGVHWFVQACREAGLMMFPDLCSVEASFRPWLDRVGQDNKDVLRVSLVRHPCDWLRSMFDGLRSEKAKWIRVFGVDLPRHDFDQFVLGYLEQTPGGIGRLFDSYKADTRMRLEDMPWAFVDLLEPFREPYGLSQKYFDRIVSLPKQERTPMARQSRWRADLRLRVLESEVNFCRDLDYY